MPNKFEKECIEKFGVLSGQIGIIHTEQKYMQNDITLLKADVGTIKDTLINSKVNNACSHAETSVWMWIMRVGMVAIVGGLVSKMFSLW